MLKCLLLATDELAISTNQSTNRTNRHKELDGVRIQTKHNSQPGNF